MGRPGAPETRALLDAPDEVGDPELTIVVSVSMTTPPVLEDTAVVILVVTEAADAVEGVGTSCVDVVATLGSDVDEELELELGSARHQAPLISSRS